MGCQKWLCLCAPIFSLISDGVGGVLLFEGQEILFTDILINVVEFKSGPFLIHQPEPKLRKGVASEFLTELPICSKLLSYHQSNEHFTMPEDHSLPLIMVCAGSGIAPFRHSIYF